MRLTTTRYICGNQSIKQRSFQVLVMHQDKCEKSQSIQNSDPSWIITFSLYKPFVVKQKSVKDILKDGSIKKNNKMLN